MWKKLPKQILLSQKRSFVLWNGYLDFYEHLQTKSPIWSGYIYNLHLHLNSAEKMRSTWKYTFDLVESHPTIQLEWNNDITTRWHQYLKSPNPNTISRRYDNSKALCKGNQLNNRTKWTCTISYIFRYITQVSLYAKH